MASTNLFDIVLAQTLLSHKGLPKQQKILEAAINLFAQKGYANTSTSEIAKEAGIAEGTLFRYYKTKETLLLALIVPFTREVTPKISQDLIDIIKLQAFESFEGLLRFLIKDRIDFIKGGKQLFQIFVKEVLYRNDFREAWFPHVTPLLFNYINEDLDCSKARGEIKDLPNEVIFRMLGSFIGGYFVSRFVILPEEILLNDDEEIDILIGLIMNGIAISK